MKRNVYFVQTGCVFNGEHFLPYASGVIASYAFSKPEICESYQFAGIIYKCDDFNETVDSIKEPNVVAFSNYMWNYKFNLKLAQALKKKFPDVCIIFGGHQIADTEQWLKENEFVDFAIFGEGEVVFSQILGKLCGDKAFDEIPNISFRKNGEIIKTHDEKICMDINTIPSPYLSGFFDQIVRNNTDKFAAVIETTRGCPYHCAYCDWGDYDLPFRRFSKDRVLQEIKWIAENKIVFVVFADSNFGMVESDNEIVDAFIDAKKTYGYPKAIEMAFAKFSSERIFEMNKKIYENNMSRGATLSMQTLSPAALKNIGRENMTRENFSDLMKLYSGHNIPAYTELILGLPGETYESFCEGIDYLLDNGQHNSIHVFCCEVLPNALMGKKEYIEKHGIQTLKRDFVLRNGENAQGMSGSSEIIVGTNDMGRDDFVRALLYSFLIQVFHNFGLLRIPAMYFHYEKGLKYFDFYNKLLNWLCDNSESYTGAIFNRFLDKYRGFVTGKGLDVYENSDYGNTQFNLPDGAFLELMKNHSQVYKDLTTFIKNNFGDMFEEDVMDELLDFQKAIVRKPENKKTILRMDHNWIEYYFNLTKKGKALIKKEQVTIEINESNEYNDEKSYAEAVLIKGRRTGKSLAINDTSSFTVY